MFRRTGQVASTEVGAPLTCACVICKESRGKAGRKRRRDGCLTASEGRVDRAAEPGTLKRELSCQDIEIVEVFVAAVALTKCGYRMKLFGHYCFMRMGSNVRSRRAKERGVVGIDRSRFDRVAESDIYLHGDAGASQGRKKLDSQTMILGGIANGFTCQCCWIKGQAVVGHLQGAYLTEGGNYVVCFGASVSCEIEIASRTVE